MRIKIEIPRTLHGATVQDLLHIGFALLPDMRNERAEGTYSVAEAPDGWRVERLSSRGHYQYLYDNLGRKRAEIFHERDYTTRARDRRWMAVLPRYMVDANAYGCRPGWRAVVVSDAGGPAGAEIHRAGAYKADATGCATRDRLVQEAQAWLKANKPDHAKGLAYWDDQVDAGQKQAVQA